MNSSDLSFWKKVEFKLVVTLGWVFILLLGKSIKLKCEGLHYMHDLEKQGIPYLVSIWHGRFLMPLYYFRYQGFIVLVSQHIDGEMIAKNIHRLGYETVRGSSTRGGAEAFQKMVVQLKNGRNTVIIPDGPTGPRHQLKPGAVFMAMKAGIPIIPMTSSADSAFFARSWDRFMVPKPFSSVLVKIGPPITIPPNCSARELVEWKRKVQQKMIAQEDTADAFFAT